MLKINKDEQVITKKYITAKYKRLAKITHPDKPGGDKEAFQELLNTYRRLIKYLEEEKGAEDDFESEFFKKHNFMKKCSSSYVVYIQKEYTDEWKRILEKHIVFQKLDKIRVIFKTGDITITLYPNPKKDPRPKLHIQSKDQDRNLEFILEKLSLFYREVCELKKTENPSIKCREIERSLCGKCGKTFINKRGLKQHILRTHMSVKKSVGNENIEVSLENTDVQNTIQEDDNQLCLALDVVINPTETESPSPTENRETDGVVESIVEELFGQSMASEKELNYQCGVCGKCFNTENESQAHIDNEHAEPNFQLSIVNENENRNLSEIVKEQERLIKSLTDKNENLVKKNIALDRENKRNKLALNECIVEKENLRKELNAQNDTISEVIKQNTTLNEELKTKNELINILKEENDIRNQKSNEQNDHSVVDDDVEIHEVDEVQPLQDDLVKCSECDFKTRNRKYLRSHMMAHRQGQYQCQRGCSEKFKTWSNLDEHHKKKHTQTRNKCNICDSAFITKEKLEEHHKNKHVMTKYICDMCNNNFVSRGSLSHHIEKEHKTSIEAA